VLSKDIAENSIVQLLTAIELKEPNEESYSDPVPVRNEVEDEAEESLCNV
jgi:hypothetical protein